MDQKPIFTREQLIYEIEKVLFKYKMGNSLVKTCAEKLADLIAELPFSGCYRKEIKPGTVVSYNED